MVPPCVRISAAKARPMAACFLAATGLSPLSRSSFSTASASVNAASARLAPGSPGSSPVFLPLRRNSSSGSSGSTSSSGGGGGSSASKRSARPPHPLGMVLPPRLSYSSAEGPAAPAARQEDGYSSSSSSSSSVSFAAGSFSIASSDLTIATRSLSDLAQVPDIAARLIGPVKKELCKDVILNARLSQRHYHGEATGVPVVEALETDFATAPTRSSSSSSASSASRSQYPASTTSSSGRAIPAQQNALAPLEEEESGAAAWSECSLTHIELTDDHIRVVFDRACEDYSRWAALASPYTQIPSDRVPEWLVPVDALNLTCVGGGCTILLERSRLRSHLLSSGGGRPDLFIASEHTAAESVAGASSTTIIKDEKSGGAGKKSNNAGNNKPSSSPSSSSSAVSSEEKKKQQRKAEKGAFPPAPS